MGPTRLKVRSDDVGAAWNKREDSGFPASGIHSQLPSQEQFASKSFSYVYSIIQFATFSHIGTHYPEIGQNWLTTAFMFLCFSKL